MPDQRAHGTIARATAPRPGGLESRRVADAAHRTNSCRSVEGLRTRYVGQPRAALAFRTNRLANGSWCQLQRQPAATAQRHSTFTTSIGSDRPLRVALRGSDVRFDSPAVAALA